MGLNLLAFCDVQALQCGGGEAGRGPGGGAKHGRAALGRRLPAGLRGRRGSGAFSLPIFPIPCTEASIWEASGDNLVGVSMSGSKSRAPFSGSVLTHQ